MTSDIFQQYVHVYQLVHLCCGFEEYRLTCFADCKISDSMIRAQMKQ